MSCLSRASWLEDMLQISDWYFALNDLVIWQAPAAHRLCMRGADRRSSFGKPFPQKMTVTQLLIL